MLASPLGDSAGIDRLNPEAGPVALDILLAYGDPASANHKLMWLLLRKWGHRVTLDATGSAGEVQPDLVLLDLDACGGAALAAPAGSAGHRVGVVSDRDAWLAQHGMAPGLDQLLAKPVDPQALRAAVQGASAARRRPGAALPGDAPESCAFDYGLALAKADAWIVGVIAQDFIQGWPGQLATLHEAHARGDTQTLERTAHTLRGLAASFNAEPVCRISRAIEQAGDAGTQARFSQWHADLARELAALNAALVAFGRASARH